MNEQCNIILGDEEQPSASNGNHNRVRGRAIAPIFTNLSSFVSIQVLKRHNAGSDLSTSASEMPRSQMCELVGLVRRDETISCVQEPDDWYLHQATPQLLGQYEPRL